MTFKPIFDERGHMIIPEMQGRLDRYVTSEKDGRMVVTEAYCPNGHSLISDETIDGEKALHFIYTDADGQRETEILISPVVRKRIKKIVKGQGFHKGETVKVLCPTCRVELPILFHCECGAPIAMFYCDTRMDHHVGQSFCTRIGCVKASRLRYSDDMLRELRNNYEL